MYEKDEEFELNNGDSITLTSESVNDLVFGKDQAKYEKNIEDEMKKADQEPELAND